MDLQQRLLNLEEQFWKGDAEFYRRHLTTDALMVFSEPVGMLDKEMTVRTIAAAPRWDEVGFQDLRIVELNEGAAVVSYRVRARRAGEATDYAAFASSAYVKRDGDWKLAFHQQTPTAA